MAKKKPDDSFSAQETKQRFEAALRGARIAGHKPMDSLKAEPKTKARSKKKAVKR